MLCIYRDCGQQQLEAGQLTKIYKALPRDTLSVGVGGGGV